MDDASREKPDERLIAATLSGDDGAFALLVTRHKHRVFALASRFARDHDELEDICQEAFIKAYDKLGTYRHEAPFEHWISRITVRACYDALRARRHEKHSQALDGMQVDIKDEAELARSQACQARELLKWAMGFLSPDERLVITLMELEEMTLRETAEMTGWSETNVKVRAYRARQALKKILEKNDVRHA
jgi:RNA polymerase sigma-70 factor (ECF subfamily)